MKQFIIIISILFSTVFVFGQVESGFVYEVGIGAGFFTGNHNLSPRGVIYRENYKSASPSLNARAHYVFNNNMSLGLKYHSFTTTGNYFTETLNRITENINAYYIAPQVGYVYPVSSKVSLGLNTGIGYLYYLNTGLESGSEYSIHSNLAGGNADFSLEYFLKNNLSLGLNTAFFSSFYSNKIHVDKNGSSYIVKPDNWNKIRISKVDFSVFLRIKI